MTTNTDVWLEYLLVDVFTDTPYRGNPLAVVLDADPLTADRMQAIAAEMNLSETAFVSAPEAEGADYRLRIFTPTRELPFAGHPSIGTAHVMRETGRLSSHTLLRTVQQQVNIGVLPIDLESEAGGACRITMTQGRPQLGDPAPDADEIAGALRVSRQEVEETGLVPQIVSTGLSQLFVPLGTMEVVASLAPDMDRLGDLERRHDFTGCAVFSLETEFPGAFAHLRFFTPSSGIREDPATGSAAGGLGAYLLMQGVLDTSVNPAEFAIEQGIEMGRPSRLYVEVSHDAAMPTQVRVGGTAVTVARGRLRA